MPCVLVTIACSAALTVDQPRSAALALFTPEGERSWASGWDPDFPCPDRREGPGAVFVTTHGEETTTWVMVDQNEDGVRYARSTPGHSAGTVAVSVLDAQPASTRLRVDYDLTALSSSGEQWLATFADGFDSYIEHWAVAIAAAADPRS